MGEKVIAVDLEDVKSVIAEEEYIFIFSTLINCGIDEEILEPCFPLDGVLSIDQKIELRKICEKFSISIINDYDGGIKIYLENKDIIAEWMKPKFHLRKDVSILNKSKQLYNEIHFKWTSKHEEKEDD